MTETLQSPYLYGIKTKRAEVATNELSALDRQPLHYQEDNPLNLHSERPYSAQVDKENDSSLKLVLESLDYDPLAGLLVWKVRPRDHFASESSYKQWNNKFPGKLAFNTKTPRGYLVGSIGNQNFFAHRVAWACAHGEWPTLCIDHENRVKSDNRLENLRNVEQATNLLNRGRFKNGTGITGVSRRGIKWRAVIVRRKKVHFLGSFHCFAKAVSARKAAEAAR